MDLATLTAQSFARHMHERFAISGPDGRLDLILTEIEEFGRAAGGRNAFSVRFIGPPRPVLPQAIYRLENEAMGALEIFVVPLGPKDGGMRYEAVFT